MSRKSHKNQIYYFVVFILLFAVNSVWSFDRDWTNSSGDRLWRTSANWSGGIPAASDKAAIRNDTVLGPIIDSSTAAEVNQVVIGDLTSSSDTLDMTGGTLTVHDWFILGYNDINAGTFTLTDGTVNIGGNLFVGHFGIGRLTMTDGSLSVSGTFAISDQAVGYGNVYLHGGTIQCNAFSMASGGALDIEQGTLIINGDARTDVNRYVGWGIITGYAGAVIINVDYNSITNKTTVSAPIILKASKPAPANSAAQIGIYPNLSWTAGFSATSHDVYFGTTSPGTFRGNQTATTYNPSALAKNTTYYWRIDEHNASGTTTGDVWSFTTTPAGDYFVGAYYYPWYAYNNFHAGTSPTGSTTLIYHLSPRQTPQLGWYNQTASTAAISKHFKWAKYAGINFFACSYWGAGSTEDATIRNCMFNNPDRGDIKLAVLLEPSVTPLGNSVNAASVTSTTNYLCDNYFNQPGYFRINNKPVVFIYITRAMTDANLAMCISSIRNAAAAKGLAGVYIVGDEVWNYPNTGSAEINRISQMDAVTNYDVYGNLGKAKYVTDSILSTWQSKNSSWKTFVNNNGKQFIPGVSPGFNNRGFSLSANLPASSRKLNSETSAFGTLFSSMLDRAKLSMDTSDIVMVTSWNEWHEDTQIEPTISAPAVNIDDSGTQAYTQGVYYEGYGTRYLNILRDKTTLLSLCDYNNDYYVDFDDLAFVLDYWLESCGTGNSCIEADLNSSGTVALDDFANCAQDWTGN